MTKKQPAKKTTTKKPTAKAGAKKPAPKKPRKMARSTPPPAIVATEAEPAATPAKPKAKTEKPDKRMSALDAAAKVLTEAGEPMATKAMIDAMAAKGYWTSPGGKTPHATLYSAIIREINTKGAEARFQKTDRGQFAANAGANTPAEPAAKATGKKAAPKTGKSTIADGTPGPKAVSDLFKI